MPPHIAFMLDHGETKVLITDREFSRRHEARRLKLAKTQAAGHRLRRSRISASAGERARRARLRGTSSPSGDPDFAWRMPDDEWDAIALNYTSGTTGNPKGVVYHHRGAALMCYAQRARRPAWAGIRSISGRCRCSTATAGASRGRSRSWPARMCACAGCAPRRSTTRSPSTGVTHLCGAPIVMSTLLNAPETTKRRVRRRRSSSSPPPRRRPKRCSPAMADAGFSVTHVYGLTETYGPAVVNEWHADWDALRRGRAAPR